MEIGSEVEEEQGTDWFCVIYQGDVIKKGPF